MTSQTPRLGTTVLNHRMYFAVYSILQTRKPHLQSEHTHCIVLGLIYSYLSLYSTPCTETSRARRKGWLKCDSVTSCIGGRADHLSLADSIAGKFLTSLSNGLTGCVGSWPAEYLMTVNALVRCVWVPWVCLISRLGLAFSLPHLGLLNQIHPITKLLYRLTEQLAGWLAGWWAAAPSVISSAPLAWLQY